MNFYVPIQLTVCLAAFTLACTGCGSKEEGAPKETKAPQTAVSVSAPDDAGAPPPPPPPPSAPTPEQAPEPDAPAGPTADDAIVAQYNLELSAWINSRDTVPADLEDLKKRTGLPPLPKAPPGKKIVYKPNFQLPTQSRISVE